MSMYSASKFAVVGMSESLRVELAGTGVTVTTVCPGYVKTGLHEATRYSNAGFRAFLDKPRRGHGLSADSVARRSIRATLDRRPVLVLGPEKAGVWLRRLSPSLYTHLANRASRAVGLLGREAG